MLSESQFNEAKEALANDKNMPGNVRADLTRLVGEYEAQRQKATPYARPPLEETSMLGPTGLEAGSPASKNLPLAPAEERPGLDPELLHKMDVLRSAPAKAPSKFSPSGPADFSGQLTENRRTSSSGRADIYRPPEFVPPTPTAAANDLDSVWGKLAAVKRSLPASFGGETEHFLEPTIEQFRIDMAPVLGPEVARIPESDRLFHVWKDEKWRQAYDAAQAAGHPIVRQHYRKPVQGDTIADALETGVGASKAALVGVDRMLTGGLASTALTSPVTPREAKQFHEASRRYSAAQSPEDVISAGEALPRETYADLSRKRDLIEAQNPIVGSTGSAVGALLPDGIGSQVVKGAGALLRKAPSLLPGGMFLEGAAQAGLQAAGESIPGRLLGHAASGYVGGAATRGAEEIPKVALGSDDISDLVREMNSAGLMGAPMGLLGGALGEGIAAEGRALRRDTPLGVAEQGGARVRPIRGVEPGKTNRGLEARARAEGVGEPYAPDVPGMLAHDLAEPFGRQAHAREEANLRAGQPLRDFERQFANERHPLKNTIRAIMEAKQKLVQSDGTIASVNQPEMAKLDKLLNDVMSTERQAPEYQLSPKDPRRLDQLEKAVDVHGELGTPETYQRDVQNIHEMSTPTRAITPQAEQVAASQRSPLATAPDFGPYAEGLPGVEGGIEAGMAGERIRSLHEARRASPDTFDMTAKEATSHGLGEGLAPDDFLRATPKPKNPNDLRELTAGVRQRHESTSSTSKEPFPDYEKIKRAFHQDRDAFTGETSDIKQSNSFRLENGEVVRGYSAANAQLENRMRELENTLDLIGFKGRAPDMRSDTDFTQMEARARAFGKGGRSPEIDRAFREMADETGMTPTLENLQRYRAMKELEQQTALKSHFPYVSGTSARLRLDPILQTLIPYLGRTGNLGAGPGLLEDRQDLPPMADQATLNEIRRALGQ